MMDNCTAGKLAQMMIPIQSLIPSPQAGYDQRTGLIPSLVNSETSQIRDRPVQDLGQ